MARVHAKPEWKTQSVLLRKTLPSGKSAEFPTKGEARHWLLLHGYKAHDIEDSAIKPGGLPEGMGHFWRARRFDPASDGRRVAMVVLGKGKRRGSVMLVRELQP